MEKILINAYILTFILICIIFVYSLISLYLMKKPDSIITIYNKTKGRVNLDIKKLSRIQFIVMWIALGLFIIEITLLIFIKYII